MFTSFLEVPAAPPETAGRALASSPADWVSTPVISDPNVNDSTAPDKQISITLGN